MATASALEQYMLELVNAERLKVGAQALAFDGALNEAADRHSAWMIAADTFSHTGSKGSTPTQRMSEAGFAFLGSWAAAENIAWASTRGPSGFQDEVEFLHTNLMESAGHRANILNGTYREIGIGFATGQYQSWDSAFVTQDFALTRTNPFLTGVAFDDRDADRFYDPGEGLGGIAVAAVGSTGARYATTTTESGGYDLVLPTGTYNVIFSGGGFATVTRQVTIGSANVKLDLVDPTKLAGSGTAASDTIYGTSGKDVIKGLAGNDRLYGGAGADVLVGGSGNDVIKGGGGNDRESGGTGRDILSGDAGKDVLTGGLDADMFRFRGRWGDDRITDFQNGVDHIDLRRTELSFGELSVTQRDMDGDGRVDDVLIRGNQQTITLLNEKVSGIGASDFLF